MIASRRRQTRLTLRMERRSMRGVMCTRVRVDQDTASKRCETDAKCSHADTRRYRLVARRYPCPRKLLSPPHPADDMPASPAAAATNSACLDLAQACRLLAPRYSYGTM